MTRRGLMSRRFTVSAQSIGELFRKVAPTVVVIQAKGHDLSRAGQDRFNETGAGVIVSGDGKVVTAASHGVHTMDHIPVGFLGRETWPPGCSAAAQYR